MSTAVHNFVIDHLEEVTNEMGGVIGYRLNLDTDETEQLLRLIENEQSRRLLRLVWNHMHGQNMDGTWRHWPGHEACTANWNKLSDAIGDYLEPALAGTHPREHGGSIPL